jgi:hypothetical protein
MYGVCLAFVGATLRSRPAGGHIGPPLQDRVSGGQHEHA